MGSKPFSDADVRRRLLASATATPVPEGFPEYHMDFFLNQDECFSTERGYSRILRSEYEIEALFALLTYWQQDSFRTISLRFESQAEQRPQAHQQTLTPVRQALDAFINFRKHAIALETLAFGASLQHAELTIAAELAADHTTRAYRDFALHEFFVLLGGDRRASEHALLTGHSFAVLRKRYQVKLSATTFELDAWRAGLLRTMQQLQASVSPRYRDFAEMRQEMALRERLR